MDHEETIDQLGGARMLRAMLGVKQIVTADTTIRFRFKGSRTYNMCEIELDPSDTYTVRLGQVDRYGLLLKGWKSETSDVYCDMLQGVFENATGLLTSMGKVEFGNFS
jgi:hypothetical protein